MGSMTSTVPACPECPENGDVRHFGFGYTCDDCGIMFTTGGGAVTVHGPRPGYHDHDHDHDEP